MLKLPLGFARFQPQEVRRRFALHLTAKLVGTGLVAASGHSGDWRLPLHPGVRRRGRRGPRPGALHQPAQHRLDAHRGVPGVLHAGRLHGARRSGFAQRARRSTSSSRGSSRYTCPVRHPLLRLRLRLHAFGSGNGFIGLQYFFLQNAPETLRKHRGAAPRLLALPVRVRRYVQHHHLGRDGRPHQLRRGPRVQRRRQRLHLPDHRPPGLGARRLAQHDQARRVPRLRRLHRRPHRSAASSPSPARSRARPRASVASSSATAAARPRATTW